jgi:hypothetical protein
MIQLYKERLLRGFRLSQYDRIVDKMKKISIQPTVNWLNFILTVEEMFRFVYYNKCPCDTIDASNQSQGFAV